MMTSRWLTIRTPILMACAVFLINIEIITANLTIYDLGDTFPVNVTYLQWVISAYMLTFSATLILAGNLTDRFGAQRILTTGFLLFILASGTSGCAPSFLLLIISRLLQGIAASLTFAAASTLLFQNMPIERKSLAQVYAGTAMSSGVILAPFLGGFLLDHGGWRAVFLFNIPTIALLWLSCHFVLKQQPHAHEHKPIPYLNAGLLVIGLLLLVHSVTQINSPTDITLTTILILAVALTLLLAYVIVELNSTRPLIEIHLLKDRTYSLTSLIRFMLQGIMFFYYFAIAILSEKAFQLSAMQTAFTFLLPGCALGVSYLTSSRIALRYGYIVALKPFCFVYLLCCLLIFIPGVGNHLWAIVLFNGLLFYAAGMINSLLTTYILTRSHPQKVGAANGMIGTFAFIGATFTLVISSIIMLHSSNQEISNWLEKQNWHLSSQATTEIYQLASGDQNLTDSKNLLTKTQLAALHQIFPSTLLTGYRWAMLFFSCLGFFALLATFFLRAPPPADSLNTDKTKPDA